MGEQISDVQKGGESDVALDTLYDKKFVAMRYGISPNTLNMWVFKKLIPYRKIGKNIRFSERDLAKWEKARTVVPEYNEIQPNVS